MRQRFVFDLEFEYHCFKETQKNQLLSSQFFFLINNHRHSLGKFEACRLTFATPPPPGFQRGQVCHTFWVRGTSNNEAQDGVIDQHRQEIRFLCNITTPSSDIKPF